MLEFKTLLAFAKDSMSCMAYFYEDSWCATPEDVESPFSKIMGKAIISFTLYYSDWLNFVAEDIVCRVDEDYEEFFEFGYELADQLFQDEPFMELIAVCSFITYVAHIFFIMGERRFMDDGYFMIAIIFLKLRNRFEANGSWEEFQKLCIEFVEMVEKERKAEQQNLTENVHTSIKFYGESATAIQNSTRISEHSTFTRSISADSIPKPSRPILKYTDVITKPTGVIPKSTGAIPKSSSAIPKSSCAIPKSTGAIPKSTGAIPKSTGAIPKSTGAIPKSTGAIPKSTGAIPKSTRAKPKSTGAIPKSTGDFQKPTGTVPKSTADSQKRTGTVPESTGEIPKSKQTSGVALKSSVVIPKSTKSRAKKNWCSSKKD